MAVLPFEVLSAEPESATYGRALGLSLSAKLTNLEGRELIAYHYAGDQPIRQVASELQLSYLIAGAVLKSADHFRVTVNLIQVFGGVQIWAREYEFGIDEILGGQSRIVASVLHEIIARLGLQHVRPRGLASVA